MSVKWVPCSKCGKRHSIPFGLLDVAKKLEITCECGERILREDAPKAPIRDDDMPH